MALDSQAGVDGGRGPAQRPLAWLTAALILALAATLGHFLTRPVPISLADLPRTAVPLEELEPGGPAFSPDGRHILYTAVVGDTRQVFLRELGSLDSRQVTRQPQGARAVSWAPDAARFYFLSENQLFSQPLSVFRPELVLSDVFNYALTPDGRGVIFAAADPRSFTLKILHPFGSAIRPLRSVPWEVRQPGTAPQSVLAFAPDGKQFLFAFGGLEQAARLFVIPWPEATGEPSEIPLRESPDELHPQTFAWLGDNRTIVAEHRVGVRNGLDFIDTRSGERRSHFSADGRLAVGAVDVRHDRLLVHEVQANWGAWSYSLTDHRLSRLYDTSHHETEPAWSPDGTKFVFVARYGQREEVWLKDLQLDEKRLLFQSSETGDPSAVLHSPVFSPDGRRIAVTAAVKPSLIPCGSAIYLVPTEKGEATRLAGDFFPGIQALDWSPDGRSLAFRELRGRLKIFALDTGKFTTPGPEPPTRSSTTWSRDGAWIASLTREGVWLLSPDGTRLRLVSRRSLAQQDAPAHCFSADGRSLYLLRPDGPFAKLEELVLATDELHTLVTFPGAVPRDGFNRGLRLHPDGKSIVFTSGSVNHKFWIVDGVAAALPR